MSDRLLAVEPRGPLIRLMSQSPRVRRQQLFFDHLSAGDDQVVSQNLGPLVGDCVAVLDFLFASLRQGHMSLEPPHNPLLLLLELIVFPLKVLEFLFIAQAFPFQSANGLVDGCRELPAVGRGPSGGSHFRKHDLQVTIIGSLAQSLQPFCWRGHD